MLRCCRASGGPPVGSPPHGAPCGCGRARSGGGVPVGPPPLGAPGGMISRWRWLPGCVGVGGTVVCGDLVCWRSIVWLSGWIGSWAVASAGGYTVAIWPVSALLVLMLSLCCILGPGPCPVGELPVGRSPSHWLVCVTFGGRRRLCHGDEAPIPNSWDRALADGCRWVLTNRWWMIGWYHLSLHDHPFAYLNSHAGGYST